MSKKTESKPKEKPFYRPFEALAKQKLAALQKDGKDGKDGKAAPPRSDSKPAASSPARSEPTPPEPESFAELLYGVTPLQRDGRTPRPAPAATAAAGATSAEPAVDPDAEAVRAHLQALVNGTAAPFEIHDDGRFLEGRRVDIDPRLARRLRRGEFAVDLRCDLHGLSAPEARARLEDVLPRARQRGDQLLLLIHGKGQHSPGGRGVLRGEMAAWLSQGTVSTHVAAFCTAAPDDGGEGALYVLLRRP